MRLLALAVAVLAILVGVAYVYAPQFALDSTPPASSSSSTGDSASATSSLPADASHPSVTIGNARIRVTLADTREERERGLSGQSGLARNEGMLFVFPAAGRYGFWMKDMLFSIDIIWISSTGEVVHVVHNATPESYPTSYNSEKDAQYVLEVEAGFAKAHNIAPGDMATIRW